MAHSSRDSPKSRNPATRLYLPAAHSALRVRRSSLPRLTSTMAQGWMWGKCSRVQAEHNFPQLPVMGVVCAPQHGQCRLSFVPVQDLLGHAGQGQGLDVHQLIRGVEGRGRQRWFKEHAAADRDSTQRLALPAADAECWVLRDHQPLRQSAVGQAETVRSCLQDHAVALTTAQNPSSAGRSAPGTQKSKGSNR